MILHPLKNSKAIITSKFGSRIHPITGVQKFHNGVDYSASDNTPIYAIENGFVSGMLENSVGGKQLLVTHPNIKVRSGFAHLNKRFVFDGQQVNKGQLIGLTGSTGNVTGPHLHFTLKTTDTKEYINPDSIQYTDNAFNWKRWLIIGGIAGGSYLLYKRYGK